MGPSLKGPLTKTYGNIQFSSYSYFLLPSQGRSIISGNGVITENLSKFVDDHLRPFVTNLPSYIKDTIHLLQNLDGLCLPSGSLLVAIDVEALYSSIPHNLGLSAVKHFISQSHKDDRKLNAFLIDALKYILTRNVFSFDGSQYLQMQV